jgi:hypothetical protein
MGPLNPTLASAEFARLTHRCPSASRAAFKTHIRNFICKCGESAKSAQMCARRSPQVPVAFLGCGGISQIWQSSLNVAGTRAAGTRSFVTRISRGPYWPRSTGGTERLKRVLKLITKRNLDGDLEHEPLVRVFVRQPGELTRAD